MKSGFYPRLALDGIRKNRRMYLPYLLTCIGMVMMCYILFYLQTSEQLGLVREVLYFGCWVIVFFAAIFLFYTNSLLIRRRKKEFGLYNVLGMGKKNLGLIALWESIFVTAASLAPGLAGGVLLSKLAELGALNLLGAEVDYDLSVSVTGLGLTCLTFGLIFLLLLLNTLRQICFSSAVSLLKSEAAGEKPPKANRFLGLLGALLLAAAYYIALTIEDPLTAIPFFFAAVMLVILATYLLMISGSVLFCRLLQKNKSYYYKSGHFVSTASMAYRMKRNGAGLASICILATMVLVMLSSTTALYFGEEDVLRTRYPGEITARAQFAQDSKAFSEDNIAAMREAIDGAAKKHGADLKMVLDYRSAEIRGLLTGDTVCDLPYADDPVQNISSGVCNFIIVSLDDYNRASGTNKALAGDEALIYDPASIYSGDSLAFSGGRRYRLREVLTDCFVGRNAIELTIALVVPDVEAAVKDLRGWGWYWDYDFDAGLEPEAENAMMEELVGIFGKPESMGRITPPKTIIFASREAHRVEYHSAFGGLFYLGIVLSAVFILAAVLIIYYKQISEGYEDQSRFEIMQAVGMTKKEIRKSINSQLLTVFFLPLAFAGLHLTFAFRIIKKLLMTFNMFNFRLFGFTTVVSFLAFAVFYALVYKLTSNAYYHIVSAAGERRRQYFGIRK